MEIASAQRPATDRQGGARPDPKNEFREPLWGAPRIHGELLKLDINVAQSTVSIYMVPRQGRPLQSWKTFLCNHGKDIASIDLFVVPRIAFRGLFVCLVLGHQRRRLFGFAVSPPNHRSISLAHGTQISHP